MPGGATKSKRRLASGAGTIAANLPDLDLVYTSVTPAPLGYLLHHRGHTHTVAGLAVLAGALVLAYRLLPPVRNLRTRERLRLWTLIVAALATHVLLDALNSYGVHPFWPIDPNWYYGDAVFIFEPSLWVLLGLAVAFNGQRRTRFLTTLPVLIFPVTMASMGVIPIEALASIGSVAVPYVWMMRRLSPRARAGIALTASMLVIATLVPISRAARHSAVGALAPHLRGRLVDVIMTPNPASPLCWAVIGIELDEAGGRYVLWRGTLSLAPSWKAPTACASHRFDGTPDARIIGNGRFAVGDEIGQSLDTLRDLNRSDCWVRAWLQFGRAPVIAPREIFDLRFGERVGQNFTLMRLAGDSHASRCPPNATNWGVPRADLLSR